MSAITTTYFFEKDIQDAEEAESNISNNDKVISELAADKLKIHQKETLQKYQNEVSELRKRAESAKVSATRAKWVAVASVIVTIVILFIAIFI